MSFIPIDKRKEKAEITEFVLKALEHLRQAEFDLGVAAVKAVHIEDKDLNEAFRLISERFFGVDQEVYVRIQTILDELKKGEPEE